jgi:nitrite reductase/ring-hydroxylating ferredoxin subunit/alkylhydroperoxidase/carboxymuconolactone decarboxylase family protein YurZ
MSDALDYLLKARPEAMQAYFSFLKQAGKHLDPKTRAIISVITKVDNQTATGFRQYLKRALREGVTAAELLDALLMAFPTLGLSKIIWAVDILLEMDLPEFRLDNQVSEQWHDVAAMDGLRHNEPACFELDDKVLFVYMDGDEPVVYDDICPHRSSRFTRESQCGNTLTCPGHQWEFDLTTGAATGHKNKFLDRLETRVEDNRLLVKWS